MPDTKPTEGTMNYMVFKIIGGGEMFYIKSLIQLHTNANGEITAEVVKEEADCNE